MDRILKNPMSQEQYDAIKASSPGYRFEGTIETYWSPMYCSPTHYHEKKKALKLNDGRFFASFDPKLPVGENSCCGLPEGTKIVIDIPPGSMSPFNYFVNEAMKIEPCDAKILWCKEHPEPPPAWDDGEEEDE